MRFICKIAAALGVLVAAQGYALAAVEVDVNLSSQTMRVRSGSGESYVWPISSGRRGYSTPRGVFRPRALYTMVHSAKYGNAPMPHSIFFHGEYAIHGTTAVGALGRPASHGCIRLSPENAAVLFAMVQSQGAVIRVVGSAGDRAVAHRRTHAFDSAAAYAPVQETPSLDEWGPNPIER